MAGPLQRAFWLGALLAAFNAGVSPAYGQAGRPIEYSTPRNERGGADKPTLLPGQTRLDQLESDLNGQFKSFLHDNNSLNGMIMTAPPPLPPPTVQNPKVKELLYKSKDWMFLKDDEIYPLDSPEDKYKPEELLPDGRKKSDVRPMERSYLDSLNGQQNFTNQSNPALESIYRNYSGSPYPDANAAGTSPGVMGQLEKSFRETFGMAADPQRSSAEQAADFFGFNQGYQPKTELTPAEIERRNQFLQILDPNGAPSVDAAQGTENMSSMRWVDSSFYDPSPPAAPAPVTKPNSSPSLDDSGLSANAASAWTQPAPPPPAPSRVVVPPPSPFLSIPRRSF